MTQRCVISCQLWYFYERSFWQHPFTAEDPLMSKWCNAELLQICSNEWMMHLYSALLCIVVHPKHFTIMWGGGLFSTTTSVQHTLEWCDGCHRTMAPVRSPHTSYRWRAERVKEPIKWMGIIRRPWLTRASGGNLARTPGLHPYSIREVPWDFLWPQRVMKKQTQLHLGWPEKFQQIKILGLTVPLIY